MNVEVGQIREKKTLVIGGMDSTESRNSVDFLLTAIEGVADVALHKEAGKATITFDPQLVSLPTLISALEDSGHAVSGEDESTSEFASAVRAEALGLEIERIILPVEGMTCSNCAQSVGTALSQIAGVETVTVNVLLDQASVEFDPYRTSPEHMAAAVKRAGYNVPDEALPSLDDSALKREGNRLILAALLTVPLVVPMLAMLFGVRWDLNPWIQLALASPVQFWIGFRFYRGAAHAIRNRVGNMDVLVATGTSAAFGYSFAVLMALQFNNGALGQGLYFESSAVIITMVLLGKWLERRAKRNSRAAIRSLMALQPELANRIDGDEIEEVPVSQIYQDDLILVRPGDRLPVDGVIIKGTTVVDESLVTGESFPVTKQLGDEVIGGSVNGTGLVTVRATAVGEDAALSRIIQLVTNAQTSKAPIQQLADRIAGIFVPVVLLIATLTFLVWLVATGDSVAGLIAAISVLVISCPCALGLATPAALAAGTTVAAKNGVLIRDIDALQKIREVDVVVLDKTGTLTIGHPVVTDVVPVNNVGERELIELVGSAQLGSEHPLATAILEKASELDIRLHAPVSFEAIAGKGIKALVGERTLIAGAADLLSDFDIPLDDPELAATASRLSQEGRSLMWVAELGSEKPLLGLLAVADPLRPDAVATMKELKARNVTPVIMSGDNDGAVAAVAATVDVPEFYARQLPQDKAERIKDLRRKGHIVAMVGDGINDAPALAEADVGIAMGTGTDVAMETAGLTLMHGHAVLLPTAIDVSKATWRKIIQNLFWAFGYNIICIPIAALGYLSPALAGSAMALSSLCVVTNASLLTRWKPAKSLRLQGTPSS